MQCSNCGKEIPITGKVCPYCHADKSADRRQTVFNAIVLWCIFLGCVFGHEATSSIVGLCIGGLVGAIVGVAIGRYFEGKRGSG